MSKRNRRKGGPRTHVDRYAKESAAAQARLQKEMEQASKEQERSKTAHPVVNAELRKNPAALRMLAQIFEESNARLA